MNATKDLDIGFFVYCAGADTSFKPFLDNPIGTAEAMVQRNCVVPMQLCHHFAESMVQRGRGGIVLFSSGAGLVGGPNMVAYGATKAFDMVFAEALWSELHDKGVDVLGLVLGKTDTRRCGDWNTHVDSCGPRTTVRRMPTPLTWSCAKRSSTSPMARR